MTGPPDTWRALPSARPDVRVWGPPLETDDEDAPRAFTCEHCGAPTAFDPRAQGLACGHCGHVSRLQAGAVAAIGEFTEAALHAAPRGWGDDRPTLHCASCGADVTLPEGHLSTSCPFCASHQVDLRVTPADALRPQQILPFALTAVEAADRAKAWLGAGWFRPADVVRAARVDAFTGVFVPTWLFDASLDCTWRCEVGVDRVVRERDSSGHTRTRTVTDWSWKSGRNTWAYSQVPVTGTTRVPGLKKLRRAEFGGLIPYTPEALAGFAARAYDRSLPEAWDEGRATLREWAAEACKSTAGGDRQRNLSMTADLNDEAWAYALLPVYVSAYRYADRTWVVLVDGASGEVAGQRPVRWGRVYLAMAALVAPGLFVGACVGLPGLLFGGLGLPFILIGVVFFLLGAIGAAVLYGQSAGDEAIE